MRDPLYYWRGTIAGIFLFGMLVHMIIPLTGMMGHRLLPPHWHDPMMSDPAAHTSAETTAFRVVSGPGGATAVPCCRHGATTGYSDGLAHSVNMVSADFFAFPVLEDAAHVLLNLPRAFQTRLAWVVPQMSACLVRVLEPPPISL